jgi:DNA-3-methyladenine glycosylase
VSEHLTLYSHLGLVASHHSADASSEPAGRGGQVEHSLSAAELSRKRRISARSDRELAKGPARLATALDIDRGLNGTDAIAHPDAPLSVLHGTPPPRDQVRNGPRTGVGGDGAAHPWRFWIDGDPTVSLYRPRTPRRRAT